MLSATEKNLGGCIFASIDRDKLQKDLNLDDENKILYVIALGKPIEKVQLDVSSGNEKYWRDDKNTHHVPKIPTEKLILNIEKI
jgi:nitroreductase